jgi:two-component system, cell cycle response regulator DivK
MTKKTILLVEDTEFSRDMTSRRLKRLGYHVITAGDGSAAIDAAKRERPDLILMDVIMPGTDGITAIKAIRATQQGAEVPIIALSARATPDDRASAIEAGANSFVQAPVEFEILQALILQYL